MAAGDVHIKVYPPSRKVVKTHTLKSGLPRRKCAQVQCQDRHGQNNLICGCLVMRQWATWPVSSL